MADTFAGDAASEAKKLPDWAWGIIAGVAVLVGLWYYRSRESSATTTATDGTGATNDGLLSGSDGTDASGDSGQTDTNTTGITSNLLWEAQALAYLSGIGYSPLTAESALDAYLNGNKLSSEAQLIVNAALSEFGAPPEGIAAPINTGTTTKHTDKAPTAPSVSLQATTDKSATVAWNAVSGAKDYVVFHTDSREPGLVESKTVTGTSWTGDFVAGSSHTVYVKAKNAHGESKSSNVLKFTLPKAKTPKQTGPKLGPVKGGPVTVKPPETKGKSDKPATTTVATPGK